jgi:hypothetical protein
MLTRLKRFIHVRKKLKGASATYAIVVWMLINVVFMALELTVFNDAADPNNSILLVLWVVSAASLLFIRKYGVAIAVFTLIYAFSFNAFNLLYFGLTIALINGISAIINLAAAIYLLIIMTRGS